MSLSDFDNYRVKPISIQTHLKAFDLEENIEFLKTLLPYGYDYLHAAKDYSYRCHVDVTQAILVKYLPELTLDEAALIMGRRNYDALTKTVIGRVTMAIFHRISLERALEIAIPALNKNSGIGHRKLVKVGPNHFRVEHTDDPSAAFPFMMNLNQGLAQRALEVFKVAGPQTQLSVTGPLSFNLEIKWQDAAH
jgi:uncharacterized protein (TIGR02265 family)